MAETPTEEFDGMTNDHRTIRELIEDWDATPAVRARRPGQPGPALVFDDPDAGAETVGFDEFFGRLDANDLALAYRTGDDENERPSDYEFVPAEEDGDDDLPADASERPADRTIDKHDEGVADRRSEVREREAEKQENPDNHRDRNPFQN